MIKVFSSSPFYSNTYVIWGEKGSAMIIDAGSPVDKIYDFVKENNLNVRYIVLTHAHFDHICFIYDYIRLFSSAKVVLHREEIKLLSDSEANVSELFGHPCVYNLDYTSVVEGDFLVLDELSLRVLHTPGHTPGSICLYEEKAGVLFTGDTLFKNGFGRTDFKYGDFYKLKGSLSYLLSLEPKTLFYSGHGDVSRIENEL